MTDTTILKKRRPSFKREHLIRLGRLLNMQYTLRELAHELGVSVDTVYRSYIPAGCPMERDGGGQIWIHGTAFREWVQALRAAKNSECAKPGRAWCFQCSKCVRILDPKIKPVNYHLELRQGTCELCGGQVNRAQAATQGGGS
jgi:hypothetical protein